MTSLRQIQEEEARKLKALQRNQQNLQPKVLSTFPLMLLSWPIAIDNPSVLDIVSRWVDLSLELTQLYIHNCVGICHLKRVFINVS